MKYLKFIHALAGFLSLAALLVNGHAVNALMNQRFPTSMEVLLLLVATLVNLSMGSYLTTYRCYKRYIQLLATLSMVAATVLTTLAVFGKVYAPMPVMLTLISASVILHAVINLKSLNPSTPVAVDNSDREMGTVKWFNVTKGFGFITRDSGDDVFVHYRAIRGEGHRTLSEGQRVEFIVVDKDKGLQAEDVITARKGC